MPAKTQPKRRSAAQRQQKTKASASKRATRRARRGEPLEAKRPRDRSPKQENL